MTNVRCCTHHGLSFCAGVDAAGAITRTVGVRGSVSNFGWHVFDETKIPAPITRRGEMGQRRTEVAVKKPEALTCQ